ncbi:MAG: DUF4252 domain-containing protein [Cyclobacteriaceae bacterium]
MIRYFFIAIFLLTAITACKTGVDSFDDEVRKTYQHEKGFFYLKVPPALLTLALRSMDDQEIMDFFGDARQVGIISFGEDFSDRENHDLFTSLEEMLTRHEYEDLIRISDMERTVSMKIKENQGKVTDMVTVISQKASPVMAITLSGEIDIQTIASMAADFDYNKLLDMQAMGNR